MNTENDRSDWPLDTVACNCVAVCTLFEGSYAIGVAALLNSLTSNGFSGDVYAGFKGAEPVGNWDVVEQHGINLHFIPLVTDYHLTNFKPEFMLSILESNPHISHLCYFDPDIVLVTKWNYILDWLECGVGLCEDVNSPLANNHPRRIGWRNHLSTSIDPLEYLTERYVNGGYIGVSRQDLHFLESWKSITLAMGHVIGGLGVAKLTGGEPFGFKGFANCFDCSDQDALNAAIEASAARVSVLSKSAMAFEPGELVMPHALGPDKPWARNFLLYAMRGIPPRIADKAFFRYVGGPIHLMPSWRYWVSRTSILLATLICRVWRR